MWPGRVLVPSGVNSIAVGQCWWSAQCRPAVMVCTRHHVLVLLCVFQMSRSLPCDWTSALHGQRWYSTGLQHLWGHSTTKQASSQSSIYSRRTFFQWPVKKDLSEMKPPPSLQMLFCLTFHPPVMHCSPVPLGETRFEWASHRVHAAPLVSNTDQTCFRDKPLWYFNDAHSSGSLVKSNKLCEIRTVRRRRLSSASDVFTHILCLQCFSLKCTSCCVCLFFTQ